MNARAMEVPAIQEFILGDEQLHARFSLAIELLVRILTASRQPVTTAALSDAVGQSPRAVRSLLASLQQSDLLRQDAVEKDAWSVATPLNAITLADIFCSVASGVSDSPRRKKPESAPPDEARTGSQQGVELLLMQATMAINQTVLQHLQAFDLGRLKAVGSSSGVHRFHPSVRTCVADPV
ncbi:MAG TPA: Rrf2 family transcriptional regulator [Noviherbaspirillum sp.]